MPAVSDAMPGSPDDVSRWREYFDATPYPLDDQLFWFMGVLFGAECSQTEIGSLRATLVGDINGDGLIDEQDPSLVLSNRS